MTWVADAGQGGQGHRSLLSTCRPATTTGWSSCNAMPEVLASQRKMLQRRGDSTDRSATRN